MASKRKMESLTADTLVIVRRHWNDYNLGSVRLDRLRSFHWREESGGVGKRSPRPMLYARMWCDALANGSVAHSCEHGPPPHEILVCLTKVDNGQKVIGQLAELVRTGASI